MINEEIANIFERVGQALEFRGKDRFRALAYERGARSLRGLEGDLTSMAAKGTLEDIPGIGQDLSRMIEEYVRTHHIRRCEQELRRVPAELLVLMDIPGLGPKTVALLHKKHHVKALADLKRLLDTDTLVGVRGFGEQKISNIKRGIALWQASKQRMLLGEALPRAEALLAEIRKIKGVERADVAGSLRRRRETIGDLDFLIISRTSARVLREFSRLPMVKQIIALGDTRATVIIEEGVQVDVRAVAERSYGAALQYFTGSKDHNVHLRTIAQKQGLKINEYGVFQGRKRLGGATEQECYRLLGLPVIPPELREDHGEIEAAVEHRLPDLIERKDLRGDLHVHTDYSDGRSTLDEMVEGAASLGYEYIALIDHSPSARIAHGLSENRLEEKIEAIESLRKQRGRHKPRILIGAEVDILSNGKLDYKDRTLARLDVVVASVHSAFRQSRDRMTGRLLDAVSNPFVQIIGHPTTRLIGGREPINFDFDQILRAAIDANVALEIDSQPDRLDLTDTLVKAANEAGALFAINSDAHSLSQLEYIRYGIFDARRGWTEAQSVINTWTWSKLSRWLGKRRSSLN
jgi:DNA polymerase (family 10)